MNVEASGDGRKNPGSPGAGARGNKETLVKNDAKNRAAAPARRSAVRSEGSGSGSNGETTGDGNARDSEKSSGSRSAEMMKKTTGATRTSRAKATTTRNQKTRKEMTDSPAPGARAARTPAPRPPAPKPAPRTSAPKAPRIPSPKELAAETLARALRRVAPAPATAHAHSVVPMVSDVSAIPASPEPTEVVMEAQSPAGSPADPPASPAGAPGYPTPASAVAPGAPPPTSVASFPDYPPFFGELDLYLTGEGKHIRLWEKMGAHPISVDGVPGVVFAVWAPNAEAVSVVGAFNQWDGRRHPMQGLGNSGIWSAFVPGLKEGDLYKYEIRTREGHLRLKSDPYAFFAEVRPASASVVWDVDKYAWNDQGWMAARRDVDLRHQPMSIYEMHLASWMRAPEDNDRWLNYRELAPRLVDHMKRYNFTHVELLPVAEHLLDQSWGYQVTGYFAPTSRHGTPDDFKFMVDLLHQNGIGVIIDWVPAHFPKDESGLRWFDGTALYEHADPRQGEHRDWGTLIFNYGRHEVRNFLLANALFWLDVYHIDGLRVDAVASMLYLDYSREEGDWLPNRYGGRENIEAIDFVRKMNELVYGEYPGAFTIAEESTDWGGVTMPTSLGGLGFGFKWDMGWMHDTLVYFSKDPVHRSHHQNDLTFAMLYAYSENFIMPLSHDEVVHGKGSLIGKMPGDDWQRYANLRSLYAYMFTRPGKKLLFMGAEFAQSWEWRSDHSLDWHLTAYAPHKGIELLVEDLGRLYRSRDALWAWDAEPQGYEWIDCSDGGASVLSYIRRGPNGFLVTVLNLTPVPRIGYRVGIPSPGYYREVLNTDSERYGGSNLGNGGGRSADGVPAHGHHWSLDLTLPPLAVVVFELAT